ncbi:MAG: DUF4197 domain-containing protein [Lysobacterales bacterium]
MRHLIVAILLIVSAPLLAKDKPKDLLNQLTGGSRTESSSSAGTGTSISESDASAGIKESLAQGVSASIKRLGTTDGFLKDQVVRIAVPKSMRTLADTASKLGAGKYVDEFETSMNRAAEKAVPAAADIFADAIRQMTVKDALGIVRGEPDAGTQYFRRVTEDKLRDSFLPIVSKATGETGVTKSYKKLSKKGGGLGGLMGGGDSMDLDGYVTDKAMDGLFYYIAEQEKSIRKNPMATGSALLGRVFGKGK